MSAEHGTTSRYSKGCRCDDCTTARRDYCRLLRRRKGIMPQGNPVEVDGVVYRTQAAAGAALGVSERAIAYHLNKHGHLARLGIKTGGGKGGRKRPVEYGGRKWQSARALALYCGVACSTIWKWIRRKDEARILAAIRAADERIIGAMMAAQAKQMQRRAA
ncbi:hypothetical protein [Paracoccus sp. 22332]|uniref:hypothetical protein n=1 Tax=Paracoccus sp. 22332 TaxID=3453913 RepID=UPI003F831AD5